MIVAYWILGILLLGTLTVIAFGLYEFYIEDRQDRANHQLHLKHFEQINHERK